jgi:hypothetical protein
MLEPAYIARTKLTEMAECEPDKRREQTVAEDSFLLFCARLLLEPRKLC